MKTLNYLLLIGCIGLFILGCSHCSETKTHFQGKTTGINPYGSGNIEVTRDAYWGNMNCIMEMMNAD